MNIYLYMNKCVVVFGGGIAGLTVCHELINKGFNILLIEKDNVLGGMARSRREKNNIPSEVSWRGYAPYYKNTFELLRKIKYNNNLTVYDNLSERIDFYSMKNKVANYNKKFVLIDNIYLIYYFLLFICSNNRQKEYYKLHVESLLKKKLSKDGYDFYAELVLGPALGIEKQNASLGHFLYFQTVSLFNNNIYEHIHYKPRKYIHKLDEYWHVMNQPTSEAWIDPWEKMLKSNNVKILLNTELLKLNHIDNKINSCVIRDIKTNKEKILNFDEYVICINPFVAEQIFKNSKINDLYRQHHLLNKKSESNQISFRFGFNKKIKFLPLVAYVHTDSEFNITLYPYEAFWDKNIKLDNSGTIKSLWSGTCCATYMKSNYYNKIGTKLSKEELIDDIKRQVLISKSFQELIYKYNNFYLEKDDITYSELWYEWEFNNKTKQLEQTNKKWVTTMYNEEFRPITKTKFSNMLLAGSHTKTSTVLYSMEGAVESGKKAAKIIDLKYNKKSNIFLHEHNSHKIFDVFKYFDDILYAFNLPNIVNVILLLLIIYIVRKIISSRLIFKFN